MAAKSASPSGSLSADARIALLIGKELFLQSAYTRRIRELLTERFGEVETVRFDGQSAQAADVLDECRSFGLMQRHKMVVVDDVDLLIRGGAKKAEDGPKKPSREEDDEPEEPEVEDSGASTRPMFERYAQAPSEGATLVLRGRKFLKGKLGPMIQKVGVIIDCDVQSPEVARKWIIDRAPERHGVQVEPEAAQLIIDRLGPDLGRLDMEVEKLAAAIGAPKQQKEGKSKPARASLPSITVLAVADLTGTTREEDMWSIKDALLTGDPEASLGHLLAILDRSGKDQSVPVTYAAIDLARQLHALSYGLRQGKSASSLATSLRIFPPWKADAVAAVARRLSPVAAAGLLAAAVDADRRSKSGLGDGERTLEMLTVRFASAIG